VKESVEFKSKNAMKQTHSAW